MKKILSIMFLFALLASSCSEDEIVKNQSTSSTSKLFTASFEGNESRTYIENGNLLRWTEGDQISLFDGNTLNRQFQFDGETGDNAGTFTVVDKPYGTGNDLSANYAVYPYAKDFKITENGVITATLPAEQSYATDSFGLGANTMVAVTEDTDDTFLKFKNVCGYLKLQLYGNDVTVKSITVTGNNNDKLAGNATIMPVYGGNPTISMADDATETITLDCGENGVKIGSTAETATAFWIVVPPTTFEKGFTVTVSNIEGRTFTKSTSNKIIVERNLIKPMNAFEVDCKIVLTSNYSNGIAYVANAGELSSIIPDDEKTAITSLKISGCLNGNDIICLRKMLGGSEFSDAEKGKLATLDLSEALIVEGGDWYYELSSTSERLYTSNDVIGNQMFRNCTTLENIVLPNTIVSIGRGAFRESKSLTSINIPTSVSFIDDLAFNECSSLKSIVIPDGVPSIGEWSFSNCSSLTSIVIPSSVTLIGKYAFRGCSSLASIDIPSAVSYIGEWAFARCSSLTSISIPDGVATIENSTFSGCSSLVSIDIPASVNSIGDFAFSTCFALESIILPDEMTAIGGFAFQSCSSLLTINIPNGVTTIEAGTFSGCYSLITLTIGNAVTSIIGSAFQNCNYLREITCYTSTPPNVDNWQYGTNTTVYVPKECETLYRNSIWGECTINEIENNDAACYLPRGSTFKSIVDIYSSMNENLSKIKFIANSTTTSQVAVGNGTKCYLIANGEWIEIHTSANEFIANEDCSYMFFLGCFTSIDFGNKFNSSNVKDMSWMFSQCQLLESLNIDIFDTSKVTNMHGMFVRCYRLKELDVSRFDVSNVTDMCAMFQGCEKLTSLDVSNFNTENVVDMSYVFSLCYGLEEIDVSRWDTSKVENMEGLFWECNFDNLDLSSFNTDNVINMRSMFSSCSNLSVLNVANFNTSKVEDMEWMFHGCSSLSELDLSGFNTISVQDMYGMFEDCSSLSKLDISNFDTSNVTNMWGMFNNCSALIELDLSNFNTVNVKKMGAMFKNCSSLTELDLSCFKTDNVESMDEMFYSCTKLKMLNINKFNTINISASYNFYRIFGNLPSVELLDLGKSFVINSDYYASIDDKFGNKDGVKIICCKKTMEVLKESCRIYNSPPITWINAETNEDF